MRTRLKVIEREANQFVIVEELSNGQVLDILHWRYEGYQGALSYFKTIPDAVDFAIKLSTGELSKPKYPKTVYTIEL